MKKSHARKKESQIKLMEAKGRREARTNPMTRCGTGNDERSEGAEEKIDRQRGDREANGGRRRKRVERN